MKKQSQNHRNMFKMVKQLVPIGLWAARWHTASLHFGRPEFESQLVDLSWIRWINKLLFGSVLTITNIKIDYFTQILPKFLTITGADNYFMADNW